MEHPESSTSTFTPVQYDPNDPTSLRWRGVPVQLGTSRYSPYARTSTTSSKPSTSLASASMIDDAESSRCPTDLTNTPQPSLKDYDKIQQQAIDWAQKRLVMDSVFVGWIRNATTEEKALMDARVTEIIAQAAITFQCVLTPSKYLKDFVSNALPKDRRRHAKKAESFVHLYNLEPPSKLSDKDRKFYMHQRRTLIYNPRLPFNYYLNGQEVNPTSIDVLVFGHPAVKGIHLSHWYQSKKSPLCNTDLRSLISTTSLHMLSGSAAATRCVIDRYVDNRLSGSSNVLRFSTEGYCGEQELIRTSMEDSLREGVHVKSLERHLLDLHHEGLRALHKMLKLPPPNIPIYIPVTAQELSIPHPISYVDTALSLSTSSPFAQMSGQAQLTGVQPQMTVLAQTPMLLSTSLPLVQMSGQASSMGVQPQMTVSALSSDLDEFDFNQWLTDLEGATPAGGSVLSHLEEPIASGSSLRLTQGRFNI